MNQVVCGLVWLKKSMQYSSNTVIQLTVLRLKKFKKGVQYSSNTVIQSTVLCYKKYLIQLQYSNTVNCNLANKPNSHHQYNSPPLGGHCRVLGVKPTVDDLRQYSSGINGLQSDMPLFQSECLLC